MNQNQQQQCGSKWNSCFLLILAALGPWGPRVTRTTKPQQAYFPIMVLGYFAIYFYRIPRPARPFDEHLRP